MLDVAKCSLIVGTLWCQRQASVIICFMFDLSADQPSSEMARDDPDTSFVQSPGRLAPSIIGTGLLVTCPA